VAGKINKLTLKVGLVLEDKASLLKQAKKIQDDLDRQSDKRYRKAKSQKDKEAKNQAKTNADLKTQSSLLSRLGKDYNTVFKGMVKFTIVQTIFKTITGQIGRQIGLMYDLDKAYTNLSIVSKATATQLSKIDIQINNMTVSLGKLKKEVINAVTEFTRAGYSISDSMTLAYNAIRGANVGDTELGKVTTFLIAGLKAFKLEAEESARVLDVLFRVANTTAINLEGIGEAFLRSANTLEMAGASLEQSAALIASANEAIQDSAKVGTALKTISSRIRGIGKEGEAIPTLAKDFKAVGIEIQNVDGSFKNVYDIFKEFSQIYKGLDDLTRESLLEKMAGKRQKNILIAMLDNFDTAEQAVKDALNSSGEVARANVKYMESLEGITNKLKETWNQFLQKLTSNKTMKILLNGLIGFINMLDVIINKAPMVTGVIATLTLAVAAMTVGVSALLGTVGIAIIALSQISSLTEIYGNRIDETVAKIQDYEVQLTSLSEKITNLKNRQDELDASSLRYLATLEAQYEAIVRLNDAEKRLLSSEYADEIDKQSKRVSFAIDTITYNMGKYVEGSDKLNDVIDTSAKHLAEYESILLSMKINLIDANKELDKGTDRYNQNLLAIAQADEALDLITDTYRAWGISISNSTDELDKQLTSAEKLAQQLADLKGITSGVVNHGVDGYQLLSNAMEELEESGYLSAESIRKLQAEFSDIVSVTELTKEGMEQYGATTRQVIIDQISDLRKKWEVELAVAKSRIIAIKEEAKALFLLVKPLSLVNKLRGLKQQETEIQNAKNNLALLDNTLKSLEGVDIQRAKNLETSSKSTASTEKEIKALTDLQLLLNNINFQIQIQQKLLSRTDGDETKARINTKLIGLYGKLKQSLIDQQVELDNVNKSIKRGEEGYDEYIQKTYELSLSIEDATNNIYNYAKANMEMALSAKEASKAITESEIEDAIKAINDELDIQIDKIEELKKASNDYYDGLISDKEDELQKLIETNSEVEDRIELERMLANLQDLRERRQNILNNKKARIVKDAEVGFEYITNPEELRNVERDIESSERDINDFKRSLVQSENEKVLQEQIDSLEKQKQAESDSYDLRILEVESFQSTINMEVENGNKITESMTRNLAGILQGIESSSYSNRLSNLGGFVNAYNAKISQLASQQRVINNMQRSIDDSFKNNTPTTNKEFKTSGELNVNKGKLIASSPSNNSNLNTTKASGGNTSKVDINHLTVKSSAKDLDTLVKDMMGAVKIFEG